VSIWCHIMSVPGSSANDVAIMSMLLKSKHIKPSRLAPSSAVSLNDIPFASSAALISATDDCASVVEHPGLPIGSTCTAAIVPTGVPALSLTGAAVGYNTR
jgi:hypothetical protein